MKVLFAIPSTTYENTPPKWDLDYLLDDKRGEMFLSALTFFENKMLRAMFVPERTITQDSSSKAGSYSLSQTHADMFLLGEEALLVDIENQVNRYIIRRLVEYNFGAKVPQCYLRIERITDARKGFLKDVFMQMVKTGTAIPAVREIADVVGVPLNDENDDGIDDKVDNKNSKGKLDSSNKSNKNNKIDNKIKVTTNNKVDKEENKKYSDSKWWREINQFEDTKILTDIETEMNKMESEYMTSLISEVWEKQKDSVLKKVSKALEDKISMENLFYSKVDNNLGGENVVLWQPLRK